MRSLILMPLTIFMRFSTLVFIIFITSCSSRSNHTPSWIIGIRDGSESLKIYNGNRILYRQLTRDRELGPDELCNKALSKAEGAIKMEFSEDLKIPYTVEIIYYDEVVQDCGVTLSISSSFMNRLKEISEIKKQEKSLRQEIEEKWDKAKQEKMKIKKDYDNLLSFINRNQDIFKKYTDLSNHIEMARNLIKIRRSRSLASAFRGLNHKEFGKLMGENVPIVFDLNSICYNRMSSSYVSYHGSIQVCWNDPESYKAFIKSYCDTTSNSCFYLDP